VKTFFFRKRNKNNGNPPLFFFQKKEAKNGGGNPLNIVIKIDTTTLIFSFGIVALKINPYRENITAIKRLRSLADFSIQIRFCGLPQNRTSLNRDVKVIHNPSARQSWAA